VIPQLDHGPFTVRLIAGALTAGLLWIVASDIGLCILDRLTVAMNSFRRAVLGAALGYAVLGGAVGLLGIVHQANALGVGTLVVLMLAFRLRTYLERLRAFPRVLAKCRVSMRSLDGTHRACLGVTVLGFVIGLVAAALPAVFWDPLAYHLPIVAWVQHHQTFSFNADIPQSGFPLLAEAAAFPAYAFVGSAGASMMTFGAGIVLTLACGMVAESVLAGGGWLATALIATSPLWLWIAPSFYVDVPFALFAICGFAVPFVVRSDVSLKDAALLSGAFAGAAAATKYPGLVVTLIAAGSLVAILWRSAAIMETKNRLRELSSCLAAFTAGFALFASGWYLRTFILTGDPVYPFLSGVARGAGAAPAQHFCGGGTSAQDALMLPVRLLIDPKSFCGDPGPSLVLGGALFVAAPFVLRSSRVWFWIAVALTAFWFYSAQQWRFLIPAMCIVAILASALAQSLQPRLRLAVSSLLIVLCLAGASVNVVPSFRAQASNSLAPAYRYILAKESGQQYLLDRVESYAASMWLAAHDRDVRVFALDDVRDYYFGPNVTWGNSPYPGGRRLDWSAAPANRYGSLLRDGFRYMVVNNNPAYTHRTLVNIDYGALREDERSGVVQKVFSENGVDVYRLRARAGD